MFAATTGVLVTKPVPPVGKSTGMGMVNKPIRMDKLLSGLNLSTTEKTQLETLINTYRTEKRNHRKQLKNELTAEARDALISAWEKREKELKNQTLNLVPSEYQQKVEKMLTKSSKKSGDAMRKGGRGFLWNFIDESTLTDAQKAEIESLAEKKRQSMQTLLQERATADATRKTAIDTELTQINQKFLESLKKYVSADKLADFETMMSETKTWSQKAEKRVKSDSSLTGSTTSLTAKAAKLKAAMATSSAQ